MQEEYEGKLRKIPPSEIPNLLLDFTSKREELLKKKLASYKEKFSNQAQTQKWEEYEGAYFKLIEDKLKAEHEYQKAKWEGIQKKFEKNTKVEFAIANLNSYLENNKVDIKNNYIIDHALAYENIKNKYDTFIDETLSSLKINDTKAYMLNMLVNGFNGALNYGRFYGARN